MNLSRLWSKLHCDANSLSYPICPICQGAKMLSDFLPLETVRAQSAVADALGLPADPQTKRQRAQLARIMLLAWNDHDAVADCFVVAARLENFFGTKDAGVWTVNAKQIAESANMDITTVVVALQLCGARQSGRFWTTHEGEVSRSHRTVPESVFTGM